MLQDFAPGLNTAASPAVITARPPSDLVGASTQRWPPQDDMLRQSESTLPALLEMLRRSASTYASLYHAEMAEQLNLGSGDIRALELVMEFEPLTTGQLATLAGLSSGGVTAVIDRLEQAGYIVRDKHRHDRRMIVLRPVAERCALLTTPPAALRETLARLSDRYDDQALQSMQVLLSRALQLMRQQTTRMLDQHVGERPISRR